ncbi:unnamed protein product [Cyprideis torosa]|uniref:non-specific serine/threonine protein kinase n=1 Tax=Cyprideis torosa TaxID=163714 RepID=A0A7R8ZKR2_9CRUS|nr:unnamed protein product [Cyprideis torosa]CAG0880753.1 unnamed protein product [Cyprideis torosa]
MESVSSRTQRLKQMFLGLSNNSARTIISTEALLDSLTLMYKEFDTLAHRDNKNVTSFLNRFESLISELQDLRVKREDFEVVDLVGRGQFGDVHLVREAASGVLFAMKSLPKRENLPTRKSSHFEEERDIMALACSPWLVSLHYSFQDSECLHFIMDFVPGGDLLGLLNRDIKPENLLLDRMGHLKLTDFGSAIRLDPKTRTYTLETPVGTEEYVPPEVLLGNGRKGQTLGTEGDYWGLGVLAYQLLYNRTPFESELTRNTYHKIMKFKEFVTYPPLESGKPMSSLARSLLESLLTERHNRLNHDSLKAHPFFESIRWDALREMSAPHIPCLTSEVDTTNFSFDRGSGHTSIAKASSPSKRQSSPLKRFGADSGVQFDTTQLPFVGMSFTRSTEGANARLSLRLSKQISGSSILDEKSCNRELQDLRKKVVHADEEMTNKNKALASVHAEKQELQKKLKDAEAKNKRLEEELVLRDKEIARLKNDLSLENASRQEMETKAIDLIKGAKERWKKEEEKKLAEMQKKLNKTKQELEEVLDEHAQSLSQRLQLEDYIKELLADKIELNKELEALKTEMEWAKQRMEYEAQNELPSPIPFDDSSVFSPAKRILDGIEASIKSMSSDLEEMRRREPPNLLMTSLNTTVNNDLSFGNLSIDLEEMRRREPPNLLMTSLNTTVNNDLSFGNLSTITEGSAHPMSEVTTASSTVEEDSFLLVGESEASLQMTPPCATEDQSTSSRRNSSVAEATSGSSSKRLSLRLNASSHSDKADQSTTKASGSSTRQASTETTMTMSVEMADLPSVHVRWQDLEDKKDKSSAPMVRWGPEEQHRMESLVRRTLKRDKEIATLKEKIQMLENKLSESAVCAQRLRDELAFAERENKRLVEEGEKERQRMEQAKIQQEERLNESSRKEDELVNMRAALESLAAKLAVRRQSQGEASDDRTSEVRQSERMKLLEEQIGRLEAQLEKARDSATTERTKAELAERELIASPTACPLSGISIILLMRPSRDMSYGSSQKEKQLSNASIDLRMAERERNEAEKTVRSLREKEREWRQGTEGVQAKVKALEAEKERVEAEVETLTEKLRQSMDKHQAEKSAWDSLVERLNEKVASQETDLRLLMKEAGAKEVADHQRRELQEEVQKLSQEKQESETKCRKMETEMRNAVSQMEAKAQELVRVAGIVKGLEEEILEVDQLNAKLTEQLQAANDELQKCQASEARLKLNLERAQSSLAEANSKVDLLERNLESLKSTLAETESEQQDLEAAHVADKDELLRRMERARRHAEDLQRELSVAQDQKRALMETTNCLTDEIVKLREQLARVRLETFDAKEEKKRLQKSLNAMTDRAEEAEISLGEAEQELEDQRAAFESLKDEFSRYKLMKESAIEQQMKLINVLQDSQENKKKKGHGIFSSAPRTPCSTPSRSIHETAVLLDRERNKVFALTTELNTLKAELAKAKGASASEMQELLKKSTAASSGSVPHHLARRALAPVLLSPRTEEEPTAVPKYISPARTRVKHNIPHKFNPMRTMLPVKCGGCLGSVPFGRIGSKCLACGLAAHQACAEKINAESPFCGLTPQMVLETTFLPSPPKTLTEAENFLDIFFSITCTWGGCSSTTNVERNNDVKRFFASDTGSQSIVEELHKENAFGKRKKRRASIVPEETLTISDGEVKQLINSEKRWEPRFLSLVADQLRIFRSAHDKEGGRPLSSYALNPVDGYTCVVACVGGSELTWVTSTDLPFVFKLELFELGDLSPKEILYFMSLSFVDKTRWVCTLEDLCKTGLGNESAFEDDLPPIQPKPIFHVPSGQGEVQCATALSPTALLLGTRRGILASAQKDSTESRLILPIEGGIFQMKALEKLQILVVISESFVGGVGGHSDQQVGKPGLNGGAHGSGGDGIGGRIGTVVSYDSTASKQGIKE